MMPAKFRKQLKSIRVILETVHLMPVLTMEIYPGSAIRKNRSASIPKVAQNRVIILTVLSPMTSVEAVHLPGRLFVKTTSGVPYRV